MAVRSIRFLMLLLAAAYLPPGMANERDSGVSAPMTRMSHCSSLDIQILVGGAITTRTCPWTAPTAAERRQGVNVAAVWRIGFGEDMPLVPEIDDIAMGQNRRAEFLFAGKPEAIATWLADMQLGNLCSGASREETEGCLCSMALRSDYIGEELVVVAKPGKHIPPSKGGGTVDPRKTGKAIASPNTKTFEVDPRAPGGSSSTRSIVPSPSLRLPLEQNLDGSHRNLLQPRFEQAA